MGHRHRNNNRLPDRETAGEWRSQRLLNFAREHKGKFLTILFAVSGVGAYVPSMFSELYAHKLAALFLRHHLIVAQPLRLIYPDLPNCTAFVTSLIPRQNITHLDLAYKFDDEISAALIRQVPLNDYSGKHGSRVEGDVSVKRPCAFDKETPLENSDTFSLNLSGDRKIAFIKAHDYGPEDAREVIFLFYPDYSIDKWKLPFHHLKATYMAFGREVKAEFAWQGLTVHVETESP